MQQNQSQINSENLIIQERKLGVKVRDHISKRLHNVLAEIHISKKKKENNAAYILTKLVLLLLYVKLDN